MNLQLFTHFNYISLILLWTGAIGGYTLAFIFFYLILCLSMYYLSDFHKDDKVDKLEKELKDLQDKLNLHWRIDDVSDFKESIKLVKRERY